MVSECFLCPVDTRVVDYIEQFLLVVCSGLRMRERCGRLDTLSSYDGVILKNEGGKLNVAGALGAVRCGAVQRCELEA